MKAMVTTQFNNLREKYIFGRPYIYHIVLSGLQSTMSGQKQDMMDLAERLKLPPSPQNTLTLLFREIVLSM